MVSLLTKINKFGHIWLYLACSMVFKNIRQTFYLFIYFKNRNKKLFAFMKSIMAPTKITKMEVFAFFSKKKFISLHEIWLV